jgi:hypothetical protein
MATLMSPYPRRLVTESCQVVTTEIGHAMLVRLTAKLAEVVNGIDISPYHEGDVVELPERDCRMLIAEHWAEAVPSRVRRTRAWRSTDAGAVAEDRPRRRPRR